MPFTYLIGWSLHNLWYYGVRYKKGSTTNDLWTIYFTSSKKVKKIREELGEPDVIQIRKIFSSIETAKAWETKVLRRLKVISKDKWINESVGKPIGGWNEGTRHSEKTKTKLRNIFLGKSLSFETKDKIRLAMKQRKLTDEHKTKIALAHKGKKKNINIEKIRKERVGRKLWTDGINEIFSFICPGDGWTRGRAQKNIRRGDRLDYIEWKCLECGNIEQRKNSTRNKQLKFCSRKCSAINREKK